MDFVYTLILMIVGYPFWLQGWASWRRHRMVRRECRLMDEEIDFLS